MTSISRGSSCRETVIRLTYTPLDFRLALVVRVEVRSTHRCPKIAPGQSVREHGLHAKRLLRIFHVSQASTWSKVGCHVPPSPIKGLGLYCLFFSYVSWPNPNFTGCRGHLLSPSTPTSTPDDASSVRTQGPAQTRRNKFHQVKIMRRSNCPTLQTSLFMPPLKCNPPS